MCIIHIIFMFIIHYISKIYEINNHKEVFSTCATLSPKQLVRICFNCSRVVAVQLLICTKFALKRAIQKDVVLKSTTV